MTSIRALDGDLYPLTDDAIIRLDGERQPGRWYVDLVYRGFPDRLVPIRWFSQFGDAHQCANRLALHLPGRAS